MPHFLEPRAVMSRLVSVVLTALVPVAVWAALVVAHIKATEAHTYLCIHGTATTFGGQFTGTATSTNSPPCVALRALMASTAANLAEVVGALFAVVTTCASVAWITCAFNAIFSCISCGRRREPKPREQQQQQQRCRLKRAHTAP